MTTVGYSEVRRCRVARRSTRQFNMLRNPEEVAQAIACFSPHEGDWGALDALAQELWASGRAQEALWAPFALFERFPSEEDGSGVFWTILHGIEALGKYEPELARSLRRQPSDFGVLLAGRMLNANIETLDGMPLASFLQSVAESPLCPESAAVTAQRFVDRNAGV